MTKQTETDLSRLPKASLLGGLAGLGAGGLVLLVTAAIALGGADPKRLATPIGLAALALGALTAGAVAGLLDRGEALLASFTGGAIYTLALRIAAIFVCEGGTSPLTVALGCAATLALALLGGLAARPRTVAPKKSAAKRRAKLRR